MGLNPRLDSESLSPASDLTPLASKPDKQTGVSLDTSAFPTSWNAIAMLAAGGDYRTRDNTPTKPERSPPTRRNLG